MNAARRMTGPCPAFWAGRRVLVTGHTGFKGAWLCLLLDRLGARVSGLALPAPFGGAFEAMRPTVESHIADIRDPVAVAGVLRAARPEIVLHLAAQALVGEGHAHPLQTFETNAMGTANLLEALRGAPAAAALVVTTDKVYRPAPAASRPVASRPGASRPGASRPGASEAMASRPVAFREDSPLGGTDPYSASKVAVEHVVAGWRGRLTDCAVATARAGNVLGGGDGGPGRLAPDVFRAHRAGTAMVLRCPNAVRPWQYVLDVLAGYLLYAQALPRGDAPEALNFGPDAAAAVTAAELTRRLQQALGSSQGWRQGEAPFAETPTLLLDSAQALRSLGWRTATDIDKAAAWTAEWHRAQWNGEDMRRVGRAQIDAWMAA